MNKKERDNLKQLKTCGKCGYYDESIKECGYWGEKREKKDVDCGEWIKTGND